MVLLGVAIKMKKTLALFLISTPLIAQVQIGKNVQIGGPGSGGSGTVTSVSVSGWPSWLTPNITNPTTTPNLTVTAGSIPNSALANNSISINSTTCTLGSSCSISGGGGAVSSVTNSDGTLVISPTTGAVVASIDLNHANQWSGSQYIRTSSNLPLRLGSADSGNTALEIDNDASNPWFMLNLGTLNTGFVGEYCMFNGTDIAYCLNGKNFALNSGSSLGWASTDPASTNIDTAFTRVSAGVVALGNGSAADASGTFEAAVGTFGTSLTVGGAGVSSVKIGTNAFSALPTCNSGAEGTMAPVNDSTTVTWGATITGGGANHVLAYCDSTNWTVAAK